MTSCNEESNNNNNNKMQIELEKLERKFTSLARQFTYTMHFYGFFQDMNLLLRDNTSPSGDTSRSRRQHRLHSRDARRQRSSCCNPQATAMTMDTTTTTTTTTGTVKSRHKAASWWLEQLTKWASLAVVVLANVTTIYFLAAHIIWELRRLDSKSSGSNKTEPAATGPQMVGQSGSGGASFAPALGWTVLKEFLDNVRRHLSRLFSLALTISWHVSCHRIELLFIDCRHYYSMFYKPQPIGHPDNQLKQTYQTDHDDTDTEQRPTANHPVRSNPTTIVMSSHELAQRNELLNANKRFYHLAHRRINLTIILPLLHFLFNVISLSLFPSSSRRRSADERPFGIASNHTNPLLALAGQAMDNFDSFHLSIHTAFHPIDHQIKKATATLAADNNDGDDDDDDNLQPTQQQQLFRNVTSVGANQSAMYCFIELLVYSVYFQGPRIVCATCLSLVLNIHYQCLRSFNRQLMTYIKRTRDKPMTHRDMISLVKQYDVIGMMHERIEHVFKWSIVQWFSLMFLNCLMHIFSFTESTSAYVVGTQNQNQNMIQQQQQQQQQQQANQHILQAQRQQQSSTSLVAVMIRLASMFFVCYSPYLIYTEAIKIESASNQMQVSMVRLSRRKDDPIAQAIEPALFESLYLSVGDYFHLSKKSMSSFMGAIVTFSVMFIEQNKKGNGKDEGEEENEISEQDSGKVGKLLEPLWAPSWNLESRSNLDSNLDGDDEGIIEKTYTSSDGDDDDDDDDGENDDDDDDTVEIDGPSQVVNDSLLAEAAADSPQTSKVEKIELRARPPFHSQSHSGKLKERKKYKHLNGFSGSSASSSGSGSGKSTSTSTSNNNNNNNNNNGYGNKRLPEAVGSLNSVALKPDARQTEGDAVMAAPILEAKYMGRVRENERLVELRPKLRLLNSGQVEVCDFSLRSAASASASSQAGPRLASYDEKHQTNKPPFSVSWIDRVNGEAVLEATDEQSMNCELVPANQRNFTFLLRAIGCNGLLSNEALVSVNLEDVNEFSPEFERPIYSLSYELDPSSDAAAPQSSDYQHYHNHHSNNNINPGSGSIDTNRNHNRRRHHHQAGDQVRRLLLQVRAHDHDCSPEFGSVCRYELSSSSSASSGSPGELDSSGQLTDGLSVDSQGRIWLHRVPAKWRQLISASSPSQPHQSQQQQPQPQVTFQVLAYDCAGKKSQRPASVQITLSKLCRPALRDVDTQISYRPGGGQRHPFAGGARLDLCGVRCHRANISVSVELHFWKQPDASRLAMDSIDRHQAKLAATARPAQCDRQPYSMVSRRRLCGARTKAIELLPPMSALNKWTQPLVDLPASTRSASSSPSSDEGENNQTEHEKRVLEGEDEDDDEPHGSINYFSPSDGDYGRRAALADRLDTPSRINPKKLAHRRATVGQRRTRTGPHVTTTEDRVPSPPPHHHHYFVGSSAASSGDAVYRDQVYSFDGSSKAAIVPRPIYASGLGEGVLFGHKHTISFWMRHAASSNSSQWPLPSPPPANGKAEPDSATESSSRHPREHLLCATSDSFSLAGSRHSHRHHHNHNHHLYSIFVRNCKLILLMRRQLSAAAAGQSASQPAKGQQSASYNNNINGASSQYWPTEWRWSLDRQRTNKACDNKWHLYSLNINYPNEVELYIDGEQFEENYDNLLIVDDLPLISLSAEASSAPRQSSSSSVVYAADDDDDGSKLTKTSSSEAILDAEQSAVSLSVGACWDWRQQQMGGHFRGQLAGLHLVAAGGAGDDSQTIECIGQCQELLVSDSRQLRRQTLQDQQQQQQQQQSGESSQQSSTTNQAAATNSLVSYQESPSKILLIGHNLLDVEEALTQIGYLNKRQFPSFIDRRRQIIVNTSLECLQQTSSSSSLQPAPAAASTTTTVIHIEPLKIDIQLETSKSLPAILISGTPNLAREYEPFTEGIQLFATVGIRLELQSLSATTSTATPPPTAPTNINNNNNDYIEDVEPPTVGQVKEANRKDDDWDGSAGLEACSVRVHPPLNNLHESISLPLDLIQQLGLYWRQSTEGSLQVYGWDSIENYQLILRSIVYKNLKPSYYSQRVFKLLCSDMNGRLVSNEYSQTITIIHLKPTDPNMLAPTSDGSASAMLLRGQSSEDTLVRLDAAVDEPLIPDDRQHSLHHRAAVASPMTMLNVAAGGAKGGEPSTKLDRLAMAFLVFVISLIAIMLVIALTNLKEPGIRSQAYRAKPACRHAEQGKLCNCPSDDDDDDDDDEDDVEDDDDDYDGDNVRDEDSVEAQGDEVETTFRRVGKKSDLLSGQQSHEGSFYADDDELMDSYSGASVETEARYWRPSRNVGSPPRASTTNTDLESLIWDEEHQDEPDDEDVAHTTVVINPLLIHEQHEMRKKEKAAAKKKKSLVYVTVEQPDKAKAVIRTRTHLSSLQRVGSSSSFSEVVCLGDTDRLDDDNEDEYCQQHQERQRPRRRRRQSESKMIPMDEEFYSSSCSSSSSSSSSSSDSILLLLLGDQEFSSAEDGALCKRHRAHHCLEEQESGQEEYCLSSNEDENEADAHYEIYHEHHAHHECLLARRRQQQQQQKQVITETNDEDDDDCDDGQQQPVASRSIGRMHED